MDDNDERRIRAMLATQTTLWRRHEMDEWGSFFAEGADFISHAGTWWKSREQNIDGHKDVPESVVPQKLNYSMTVASVREVAPQVVVAHTLWGWPDFLAPSADAAQHRRGIITSVLVKRQGQWLIEAAQNTRIV
ncbi:SgcJ/EcaC family oxidoreductase [Nocardia callitridis]|uniref:DUF4440 domain-containing protein n=1 Tax=Nocardia callitridis TaxID=648753 RepID=A0ABP9KQ35_9NOCA